MIASNDFGAPPSTSTKPSPVKNARTLLPPPSTSAIRSVRRRTPPTVCCALSTREDVHVANTPRAPFNTSLRFSDTAITSDVRDRARAVAEPVPFHADLLKQRQVEIRDRRALRQHDMPATEPHLAVTAADHDVRLRVVVVSIAVAHVRSVHEDRMIEQRSLTVWRLRHLLDEARKLLEVPGLDLGQLLDSR